MRNLLMTVLLIVVTVVLFTTIITSEDGIRAQIESQGQAARDQISGITN